MGGVIDAKPSDLIALGAYSRILSDDDVGRDGIGSDGTVVVLGCLVIVESASPSRLSFSIACSAVAPPRATIASLI